MSNQICLWLLLLLISCGSYNNDSNSSESSQEETSMEVLVDRPDVVWGFDFLPNQRLVFTQRGGGIYILDLNTRLVSAVSGAPSPSAGGEGGFLDLKTHPNYTTNNLIYICRTQQRTEGRGIVIDRAILRDGALSNVETVFSSNRANNSSIHFGCRIEFASSNQLYISLGDQNDAPQAQNQMSHLGKILRVNDDGTNLMIWSSGHRNVQGLALRPGSAELFASEHGPTGGDELNVIRQGSNYGWPLVTRGTPAGSLGQSAPGYIDPIISWTPAIAPSGMSFWRGDLYIATLRGEHIRKLTFDGTEVINQEILFEGQSTRYRNLRPGTDGALYFSTDDGKIGKIN